MLKLRPAAEEGRSHGAIVPVARLRYLAMSLSETDTQTSETVAGQLAELRGLVLALHEELCYMRGQWPRVAGQVGDLHATLSAMQPLIQRYAAAAGSPAARWARGRGRQSTVLPPSPAAEPHHCQGYAHTDAAPQPQANVTCERGYSHRWSGEIGCHDAEAGCYG